MDRGSQQYSTVEYSTSCAKRRGQWKAKGWINGSTSLDLVGSIILARLSLGSLAPCRVLLVDDRCFFLSLFLCFLPGLSSSPFLFLPLPFSSTGQSGCWESISLFDTGPLPKQSPFPSSLSDWIRSDQIRSNGVHGRSIMKADVTGWLRNNLRRLLFCHGTA